MIYIIYILIAIILLLYTSMIVQRKKYMDILFLQNNKIKLYNELYEFYINQYKNLKKELENIEEKKYIHKIYFDTIAGPIKKDPIFEGKRVLVGETIPLFANNTKNVLQSLGFKVDIVPTGKDIINAITYAPEHYDVIVCNAIYTNGTGKDFLNELKKLDNFNTPVIILYDDENEKESYLENINVVACISRTITQEDIKLVLCDLFKDKI